MAANDILAILFGSVAVVGITGGIANRLIMKKGIGAQFIRFIALVVAMPLAGALVFQHMATQAVISLILGILGYIFPGPKKEG